MSSILKSLRKIEEEKRVAAHAAPDLCVDQGLTSAKSKPFLPLLAGIALGAVVVGLFFFWSSRNTAPVAKNQSLLKSDKVVSVGKQDLRTSGVEQKEMATTANSFQTINPAGRSLKNPTESSLVYVVTPQPEPATRATLKKEKAPDVSTLVSSSSSTIQTSPAVTAVTTSLTVSPELPEGVSLLVTEIFFQEDSANSMAVVNDLPVMVGTHVDSAIVAEISPGRVLFEIGNKTYVVARTSP